MDIVNNWIQIFTSALSSGGVIAGFLLVMIESFIPILPLGVFVALNVNAFGIYLGVLISWLATCLGCFISYLIFRFLSIKFLYKIFSKKYKSKVEHAVKGINKISFTNLVLLIALPFTPAFLINIICGIAKITKKKFIAAILIGKVSIVVFWGYIGKSFIDSITDIKTLLIILLMLLISYIVSKIVSKKIGIE